MPARLSPEEREARRRARVAYSFSDAAYSHYDTSLGFGSTEEWERIATEALGVGVRYHRTTTASGSPDLTLLGLNAIPATSEELKRDFRNAMMVAHPDHGGTNEAARNVIAAFKRLAKKFD